MAGQLFQALARTVYDFSSFSTANQMISQTVLHGLDVTQYREGLLLFRIHSLSVNQSPSIRIEVYSDLPTTEDPSQDFILPAAVATTGNIALSGLASPFAMIAPLNTPFASHLRMKVNAIQGATASSVFQVAISADLLMRA